MLGLLSKSIAGFRKRHYSLFREIVSHPFIYQLLSRITARLRVTRPLDGDVALYMNPLFHSSFFAFKNLTDYEPEFRQALHQILKPGMCAYDIGANIGVFTFQMSGLVGPGGSVFAFEPEEVNIGCFQKTLSKSQITNVFLSTRCIASRSGHLLFDRRGGAFSGRCVTERSEEISKNTTRKEVVSIDDFVFQEQNRPPEFVKIDVEGNESDVIIGMSKTLKEYSPTLIVELHHHLVESFSELFEYLSNQGYQCTALSEWLSGTSQPVASLEKVHRLVALKTR